MIVGDPEVWSFRIRVAFWVLGIVLGGTMAYTGRYYINGDAIVYMEMGEALRYGHWWGLANLTYSPGYSIFLGLAQLLFQTTPANELQVLRTVNVFCLMAAMGACELVMVLVKNELDRIGYQGELPLPWPLVSALSYGMFLVAALALIRMRLMNPDMLVMAVVLAAAGVLLWIRENPIPYFKYVVLGIVTGVGYLIKSFFFPFSLIFFLAAGFSAGTLKRAVPRVTVAVVVMLVVCAPLLAALSGRLGRFTYGELGRLAYGVWISPSGVGEPIHPEIINRNPKVALYRYDVPCTRPSGFDICYWYEGFKPDIDMTAHLKIIVGNVLSVFTQVPWLALILLWFGLQWRTGSARAGSLLPPSPFLLLAVISLAGLGFYCLIHVEPRYVGPYLFLGFLALVMCLRLPEDDSKARHKTWIQAGLLIGFFLVLVAHSVVDQSLRGLHSTTDKPSYRESFMDQTALKDFLRNKGIAQGDYAALVGNLPVYWARMARLKILAEVPDPMEFFSATGQQRKTALAKLKNQGVKVVVGMGPRFADLATEGWRKVPGTRSYFVEMLDGPRPSRGGLTEPRSVQDTGQAGLQ